MKIKHIKIVKNPTTQYFLKRYDEQQMKEMIDYLNAVTLATM